VDVSFLLVILYLHRHSPTTPDDYFSLEYSNKVTIDITSLRCMLPCVLRAQPYFIDSEFYHDLRYPGSSISNAVTFVITYTSYLHQTQLNSRALGFLLGTTTEGYDCDSLTQSNEIWNVCEGFDVIDTKSNNSGHFTVIYLLKSNPVHAHLS
jgi:hypothetical protein